MRVAALVLLALCAVASSREAIAARRNRAVIADEVSRTDRLVDLGIRLRVVVADPSGEELVVGRPRLRVVDEVVRGGVVDRSLRVPEYVGPTTNPVTWYCSEQARSIVLHEADASHQLVYGAMGAGKTTLTAQWLAFRVLERVGYRGEFGVTVPTTDRFDGIRQAILDHWPVSWRTWRERRSVFLLATGHRVRLVTTTQRSRSAGSPVQGFNWMDAASEEVQDSVPVDGDVEARLRAAPDGKPRRLANATAKDDPEWRRWRDRILSTSVWVKRVVQGTDSPFIPAQHWQRLRETMTEREYQRKVLAQDVLPETVVYSQWDPAEGLRPIPHIGARDVTAREIGRANAGAQILVGCDPGRIYDASVLLKAYDVVDSTTGQWSKDPVWFVVDEVTTHRKTTEEHAVALAKKLEQWIPVTRGNAWLSQALVRIDPHSSSGADTDQPDLTVLRVFQQRGFAIKPAAYKLGTNQPARIQPEARVDMHNTLLRNAAGRRRLFVACDDKRQPTAPRLVEAYERCQRGADGRVDRGRKNEYDMTHWPCAVEYALWSLEKPRLDEARSVG